MYSKCLVYDVKFNVRKKILKKEHTNTFCAFYTIFVKNIKNCCLFSICYFNLRKYFTAREVFIQCLAPKIISYKRKKKDESKTS